MRDRSSEPRPSDSKSSATADHAVAGYARGSVSDPPPTTTVTTRNVPNDESEGQRPRKNFKNFLTDTGKAFSRTAKSTVDKAKETAHGISEQAKETAHFVSEQAKQTYVQHDISGKSKRVVERTKNGAVAGKKKFGSFDEKTNFTGIVAGIATVKAAKDFVHGRARNGVVALSIAGASVATQQHLNEERRQNDTRRRC